MFSFGTKEYENIFVDSNGIYDEDLVLITDDKVKIGDSGIYLEMGSVKILDLTIKLDMSDILFKGISYFSQDEIFMDYFGIIFNDPEQAIEDKKGFEVSVPEERPEVKLAFGKDIPARPDDIVPEGCPSVENKVCSDAEEKTCSEAETIIEYRDSVCPEEKICKVCPAPIGEGGLGGIIITAIFSILAGGIGGVYFTRNKVLGKRGGLKVYRNNKGEEVTQHKHSSVRGYHNPIVSHRDEHERHPKGQLFPYYEKNIEKDRWEFVK